MSHPDNCQCGWPEKACDLLEAGMVVRADAVAELLAVAEAARALQRVNGVRTGNLSAAVAALDRKLGKPWREGRVG